MKYLKKLIVNQNQFNLISIENKNIQITEIEVEGDDFSPLINERNKNFIIRSRIENLSFELLRHNKKIKILSKDDINQLENIIKDNTIYAYKYSMDVTQKPFPKGEIAISKNIRNSFEYAKNILRDRFPEAEDSISEDEDFAYKYAIEVIKGVWEKVHKTIVKNSMRACEYAIFLNKRWIDIPGVDKKTAHETEGLIIKDNYYFMKYIEHFFDGKRWPEAEKFLLRVDNVYSASKSIVDYAEKVLKKRWPEGEKRMLGSQQFESIIQYAIRVIKGRWLEGENVLLKSLDDIYDSNIYDNICQYAIRVIKGPWKEIEDFIFQDHVIAAEYAVKASKERLPKEVEDEIANERNVDLTIDYAIEIYKKRWPEYEKNLLEIKKELDEILNRDGNPENELGDDIGFVYIEPVIDRYTKEVIQGPWPEAGIK